MVNPIDINDHKERLAKAEEIVGYEFNDKSILLKALTHPSAVQGCSTEHSYERLEFLGDALLEAAVSFSIFRKHEDMDEGKLTQMRVAIVSGDNLSKVANGMGISELIIFGKSEQSTGKRGMKSALENVLEALVAAIFLDGGEINCWMFIVNKVVSKMIDDDRLAIEGNPKSVLQELMQVDHDTPIYNIIEEKGPAHNKSFIAEVVVDNKVLATGEGSSKKEAEVNAALNALKDRGERK